MEAGSSKKKRIEADVYCPVVSCGRKFVRRDGLRRHLASIHHSMFAEDGTVVSFSTEVKEKYAERRARDSEVKKLKRKEKKSSDGTASMMSDESSRALESASESSDSSLDLSLAAESAERQETFSLLRREVDSRARARAVNVGGDGGVSSLDFSGLGNVLMEQAIGLSCKVLLDRIKAATPAACGAEPLVVENSVNSRVTSSAPLVASGCLSSCGASSGLCQSTSEVERDLGKENVEKSPMIASDSSSLYNASMCVHRSVSDGEHEMAKDDSATSLWLRRAVDAEVNVEALPNVVVPESEDDVTTVNFVCAIGPQKVDGESLVSVDPRLIGGNRIVSSEIVLPKPVRGKRLVRSVSTAVDTVPEVVFVRRNTDSELSVGFTPDVVINEGSIVSTGDTVREVGFVPIVTMVPDVGLTLEIRKNVISNPTSEHSVGISSCPTLSMAGVPEDFILDLETSGLDLEDDVTRIENQSERVSVISNVDVSSEQIVVPESNHRSTNLTGFNFLNVSFNSVMEVAEANQREIDLMLARMKRDSLNKTQVLDPSRKYKPVLIDFVDERNFSGDLKKMFRLMDEATSWMRAKIPEPVRMDVPIKRRVNFSMTPNVSVSEVRKFPVKQVEAVPSEEVFKENDYIPDEADVDVFTRVMRPESPERELIVPDTCELRIEEKEILEKEKALEDLADRLEKRISNPKRGRILFNPVGSRDLWALGRVPRRRHTSVPLDMKRARAFRYPKEGVRAPVPVPEALKHRPMSVLTWRKWCEEKPDIVEPVEVPIVTNEVYDVCNDVFIDDEDDRLIIDEDRAPLEVVLDEFNENKVSIKTALWTLTVEEPSPMSVLPENVSLRDLDIPVSTEETVYTELESVIDIPETFVLADPEKRSMPFRGEESFVRKDHENPVLFDSVEEDVIFVKESLAEVKVVKVKREHKSDDERDQDARLRSQRVRSRKLGPCWRDNSGVNIVDGIDIDVESDESLDALGHVPKAMDKCVPRIITARKYVPVEERQVLESPVSDKVRRNLNQVMVEVDTQTEIDDLRPDLWRSDRESLIREVEIHVERSRRPRNAGEIVLTALPMFPEISAEELERHISHYILCCKQFAEGMVLNDLVVVAKEESEENELLCSFPPSLRDDFSRSREKVNHTFHRRINNCYIVRPADAVVKLPVTKKDSELVELYFSTVDPPYIRFEIESKFEEGIGEVRREVLSRLCGERIRAAQFVGREFKTYLLAYRSRKEESLQADLRLAEKLVESFFSE